MANDQLKQFMTAVLAITPRYGDLDANGIPGMGQANPGALAVERLRQAATEFARAYTGADADRLQTTAQAVEAALQVVATLAVTSSQVTDRLIADLDRLVQTTIGATGGAS